MEASARIQEWQTAIAQLSATSSRLDTELVNLCLVYNSHELNKLRSEEGGT